MPDPVATPTTRRHERIELSLNADFVRQASQVAAQEFVRAFEPILNRNRQPMEDERDVRWRDRFEHQRRAAPTYDSSRVTAAWILGLFIFLGIVVGVMLATARLPLDFSAGVPDSVSPATDSGVCGLKDKFAYYNRDGVPVYHLVPEC